MDVEKNGIHKNNFVDFFCYCVRLHKLIQQIQHFPFTFFLSKLENTEKEVESQCSAYSR
jgi:hypothetical protein